MKSVSNLADPKLSKPSSFVPFRVHLFSPTRLSMVPLRITRHGNTSNALPFSFSAMVSISCGAMAIIGTPRRRSEIFSENARRLQLPVPVAYLLFEVCRFKKAGLQLFAGQRYPAGPFQKSIACERNLHQDWM